MRLLLSFPLLALILLAYTTIVFGAERGPVVLDETIMTVSMMSGALLTLTRGDMLILVGLCLLFFEVMKAARVGAGTIIDHMLSTAVFIAALVAFLLVEVAGTSVFLILVVLCLIDVVAGYTISIRSARRDVNLDGGVF